MINVTAGNVFRIFRNKEYSLRYILWKKNPHCHYCGVLLSFEESTFDHIVPVSVLKGPNRKKYKGLKGNPKNKVISCLDCNTRSQAERFQKVQTTYFTSMILSSKESIKNQIKNGGVKINPHIS